MYIQHKNSLIIEIYVGHLYFKESKLNVRNITICGHVVMCCLLKIILFINVYIVNNLWFKHRFVILFMLFFMIFFNIIIPFV